MPQQSDIMVKVVNFRPHYKGGCLAEMELQNPSQPTPPSDGNVTFPASYKIHLHRGNGQHKVTFSIIAHPGYVNPNVPPERYSLVGVYFMNRDLAPPGSPNVERNTGRHVFKDFVYDIAAATPTLTLNIDRDKVKRDPQTAKAEKEKYEFMLLVQRESDGELGIIDPEWENE